MGGGASRTQPVEKSTAAGGAASATADSGAKDTLHASPTGRPADSTRDEHVVAEAKDGAGSSVHHDVKEHHARILHANNNNKQQQEKEEDEERYSAYERRRMLEEEQEREEEEEILALIAQSRHSQASHYYSRMGMEHDGRGSDDDEDEEEGIGYDEGGEERRTRNRTEEDETDEDEEDDANDARNAENRENWQMLTDSLEMDNEDLLFNMLYFAEQDNGGVGVGVGMSCMGRVINNAMSEAVALHSDNNTPYKLKPASADDLQVRACACACVCVCVRVRVHVLACRYSCVSINVCVGNILTSPSHPLVFGAGDLEPCRLREDAQGEWRRPLPGVRCVHGRDERRG